MTLSVFPSQVEPVLHDQVTSDRPGGWGTLGDCRVLVVGTRPRLWKTPLSCLARQHRKWINQRGEIKSGGEEGMEGRGRGGDVLSDICIFKLGIELWRNVVIIHPQLLQWWRILHWIISWSDLRSDPHLLSGPAVLHHIYKYLCWSLHHQVSVIAILGLSCDTSDMSRNISPSVCNDDVFRPGLSSHLILLPYQAGTVMHTRLYFCWFDSGICFQFFFPQTALVFDVS